MTRLLKKAVKEIEKLPEIDQNQFAKWIEHKYLSKEWKKIKKLSGQKGKVFSSPKAAKAYLQTL